MSFDGAEGKRAGEIFVHDPGRMIGGRLHDLCSRPLLPLGESLLRHGFEPHEFFRDARLELGNGDVEIARASGPPLARCGGLSTGLR